MATTKDTLLKYFATLDVDTLERLRKYAEFIIIPDEDLLTNATMLQMVEKAHSLADSLFPEWTDRSKSDFGEFLVELFALYSEKDFWYINAFANEGIFKKIRSYPNAYVKASSLGYYPRTCKGASATFNVTFADGEAIEYLRGDLIIKANGKEFTNDTPFSLAYSASQASVTIELTEGKIISEEAVFNGYNIPLKKGNIDPDSIKVRIDNVEWERVRNFGDSGVSSAHFIIIPDENGSCSLFFGSNGYGATPAMGKTVYVEYRTCSGAGGNVAIGTATINSSMDDRKALYAEMLNDAFGGEDADTLTEIKEKAPMFFSNKRCAINSKVAEQILNEYPFIHRSKVIPYGNRVCFECIPKSGSLEITNRESEQVVKEFNSQIVLGYRAVHVPNNYVDFIERFSPQAMRFIVDIYVTVGTDKSMVETTVKALVEDYTNPLVLAEYGKGFSKDSMSLLISKNINGTQNIAYKILKSDNSEEVAMDYSVEDNEIFRKINVTYIDVRVYAV